MTPTRTCASQRHIAFTLALLAAFTACATPARADILHLMNGGRIEGKVTRLPDGGYRVESTTGTSLLPEDRIRYWEKRALPETEYATRKAAVAADDFDGQLRLGLWCRKRGLPDEAKWHFTLAVALRPDDTKARRAAGFIRQSNRWITVKESMQRKGFELYGKKWLPANEALQRRMQDERKKDYETNYATAWALFRETARERKREPLGDRADTIAAIGSDIIDPLDRASADGFTRVRLLAILTAARMECAQSLGILFRRLEVEEDPALVRKLIQALVRRRDRMEVLTQSLDLLMNSPARGVRKRCWNAIDALGDPRAIDTLIPLVGKQVNGSAGTSRDETKTVGGRETVVAGPAPKKSYSPAHDALVFLTGELLPPEREAWRMWWGAKRKTFRFRGKLDYEPYPVPGQSPVTTSFTKEKKTQP